MARIRSIKPEFNTSLSIARLSDAEQLCFVKLWTYCDDEGRGIDELRLIKAALYPLDDAKTLDVLDALLCRLEDEGRIVRYVVGGKPLLQVVNWAEHQKPQHPRKSELPSPDDVSALSRNRHSVAPEQRHEDAPNAPENAHEAAPHVGTGLSPRARAVGEGSGGESRVGDPPGGNASVSETQLEPAAVDGMPTKKVDGLTLTQTLGRWLGGQGVTLPPRDRRDEVYATVLRHCLNHLGDDLGRRRSLAMGVIRDYVADVAGVALHRTAGDHLARLVNTFGPDEALAGMAEAVVWGAGLNPGHEEDLLALTKYATAVLGNRTQASAG